MKNNVILAEKIKNRAIEIDIIRGICIFLMILDHFFYDLIALMPSITNFPNVNGSSYEVYLFAFSYWSWPVRKILHHIVVFIFLAITGICCSFSRNNLARGLKLFIFSLGLTVVTLIACLIMGDVDNTIIFGVLHCIGLSLIIVGLLDKYVLNKFAFDKYIYLIIGLSMFVTGLILEETASFESLNDGNAFAVIVKSIIGISKCGGDHFPILLYGGQVFIGVFLGKLLYPNAKSLFKNKEYKNNIVTFAGRHSLWFYLAHQVIIPIVLGIILLICGFKIKF